MHEIQIFNHEVFGEIRTIEIDGEIYFVGVDVARALEYKNPSTAVAKRVKENHKKQMMIPHCQNGKGTNNQNGYLRKTTIIDESGFYSLVLASKCKGAEPFQEWVTAEVLPTIRKTGSYSLKSDLNPSRLEIKPMVYIENVENLHITQKKEVFSMKNNPTPEKKSGNRQKIGERTHIYRNADGSIFGKKVVKKFSDGSKNAVWFLFNPETNSFNPKAGLSGKKAPLYHADALHHNHDNMDMPVLIVEGEKDVETLASMEILATSLPNGGQSRQWHDDLYNDGLNGFLFPKDSSDTSRIEILKKTIEKYKPNLIIIDPWHAFCPPEVDVNRINHVRPIFQNISAICEKYDCGLILISHVNKKAQENANNAALGSVDLINASRSALTIISDGRDVASRLVVHTKINHAAHGQTIKFTIDDDGFAWNGFESTLTKDTLEEAAKLHRKPTDLIRNKPDDTALKEELLEIITELAEHGKETKIAYQQLGDMCEDETFSNLSTSKRKELIEQIARSEAFRSRGLTLGKYIQGVSYIDNHGEKKRSRGFIVSYMVTGQEMTAVMP